MGVMRVQVPAATRSGWVVVVLCLVALTPFGLFFWGRGVLFPFIQEDLDTSRAQLGLIASGMAVGQLTTSLLMGLLVDAMGSRRVLAAALAGAAVSVFLFSRIQSPVHGMLLGIPLGAALSTLAPGYLKAVMEWVTAKGRAVAVGIVEGSMPLAGIIGAVLISFFAVELGWRSTVVVLAVVIALSSVIFFTFYRDKPRGRAEGQMRTGAGTRVGLVVRDRDMWVSAFIGVAFNGITICLLSYLVLFLKESLEMSSVVAGSGMAVALAGGGLGRVGWSLFSDLVLGGRRVATMTFIGILSVVSIVAMTLLPTDAPLAVVLVLVFVVASVSLGISAMRVIFLAELVGPDLTATAMGFVSTISHVGGIVFAPLFGLIVDRTGSYDLAWWMIAGVAGAGTLLLATLSPQARRR